MQGMANPNILSFTNASKAGVFFKSSGFSIILMIRIGSATIRVIIACAAKYMDKYSRIKADGFNNGLICFEKPEA
jgi:hypothetical protein